MQETRPLACLSKRLDQADLKCHMSDRELLAAVKCLKDWKVLLSSTPFSGEVHQLVTNHQPTAIILSKNIYHKGNVGGWNYFKSFPLKYMYKSGSSNIAYPLSRFARGGSDSTSGNIDF